MKIKDIIKNISKEDKFKREVEICYFADKHLNIKVANNANVSDDSVSKRLVSYYFASLLDRHGVEKGWRIYFFDGEPVCVGDDWFGDGIERSGWLSIECYKQVKTYISSYLGEVDGCIDIADVNIVDLDEDILNHYNIPRYEFLQNHHKKNCYYRGRKCKIISYIKRTSIYDICEIEFYDNNKMQSVDVNHLDFPYYLNNNQ